MTISKKIITHNKKVFAVLASSLIIVTGGIVLYFMGRSSLGPTNSFIFWCKETKSQCNSQGLFDAYSLTHIIHGIFFYFLLWLLARKLPLEIRLVLAIILETGWEVLENTDMVINRYRAETLSLDYFGDSILNSISDIVLAFLGFWTARKLPIWASISFVFIIEIGLALLIRDNLLLNIILLVFPIPAIQNWQLGY